MSKRFDIITETDARTLNRGDVVVLKAGGHITPLAADTLRERRITVLRDGVAPEAAMSLVPAAVVRRIAIGSDHSGLVLRARLVGELRARGLAVDDQGTHGSDPVDYPDIAAGVARAVADASADAGIVIDGAGIGSAIAANKVPGIRAVNAVTETQARYSREHNGANVLTLGATLVTESDALAIVATWLATPMREPRYISRLSKIRDLERRAANEGR